MMTGKMLEQFSPARLPQRVPESGIKQATGVG